MLELGNSTLLKDEDLISEGHSCLQTVSDHQHCGGCIVLEEIRQYSLLGRCINLRCRLIKQDDLGFIREEGLG